MRNTNPILLFSTFVLAFPLLLGGCLPFVSKDSEDGEHKYEEREPYPFVQPEIVDRHRYLSHTPTGNLYSLVPQKIGVVEVRGFGADGDAEVFLKSYTKKVKSEGGSFLPDHYYVAPDGQIFGGQETDYCGYLARKRAEDALLVGVLGDFSQPTHFLSPEQERSLVQLCAWLCTRNSIDPGAIVPANEINPEVGELGVNLANYFGPTQTLRRDVEKTMALGKEEMEDDSFGASFRRRKRERPDPLDAF